MLSAPNIHLSYGRKGPARFKVVYPEPAGASFSLTCHPPNAGRACEESECCLRRASCRCEKFHCSARLAPAGGGQRDCRRGRGGRRHGHGRISAGTQRSGRRGPPCRAPPLASHDGGLEGRGVRHAAVATASSIHDPTRQSAAGARGGCRRACSEQLTMVGQVQQRTCCFQAFSLLPKSAYIPSDPSTRAAF